MQAFLDDGYSETGYLAAVPRLHSAVRFTYRPMLVLELALFSSRTVHAADVAVRREVAAWLARKILDWDVCDARGQTVPLLAQGVDPLANLLRLRPPVFMRLWKIVCGDEASDPPFTVPRDLEADAKNCEAGCGCGGCIPPWPAAIAPTACDSFTTIPAGSD